MTACKWKTIRIWKYLWPSLWIFFLIWKSWSRFRTIGQLDWDSLIPFANKGFLIRFYFRWWSHNHQHYTRNLCSKEIIETIKNLNRIPHWPSALDGQLNQPSPALVPRAHRRERARMPQGPWITSGFVSRWVRLCVRAHIVSGLKRACRIAQSRDNARLCAPVRPPAAADLWTTNAFTRPLKKARD